MPYTYTTQKQVRSAFWRDHADSPGISRKRHRYGRDLVYNTDTRCAFCDYVDMLARNGDISDKLAYRVTL